MKIVSKVVMMVLLSWTMVMLVWGLSGFFEYFSGIKPLIHLQNSAYPRTVQFVHWLLITLTGGAFVLGYFLKWKWTPFVMVMLFSNLAVLCTIQTFDFMSEQWSYTAYSTEIVLYVLLSAFLLFSSLSKSHFKHRI
ncbi:hypothetical protein [Pareuzebyella sediminis]|uniref:hypothetical protein n=1 Tax=Pareuzebyella sediminis TaxID=2607998 RepID=UPI0011EBF653|nr:hypothetical protein [Pareuzebyella sediminis]